MDKPISSIKRLSRNSPYLGRGSSMPSINETRVSGAIFQEKSLIGKGDRISFPRINYDGTREGF